MAYNLNYGFTPEQLKKLMTPPTPPPTGIETMADKVGMGDFTAEVPVAETFDYRGFNPFNPTGVPGSVGPDDKPFNPGSVGPDDKPFNPSGLQSQIDDLQGQFGDFQRFDPTNLQGQLSDLQGQFGNFQGFDPTNLQGQLSDLQGQLGDLQGQFGSYGGIVPPGPNTGGIVPPGSDTGGIVPPGFNPFNPYGGPWTGVVPDVTAPVVDPIANLTPMPPRDTNVRVATNYPRKAPPPTFFEPSINPFERPEE